MDRKHAAKGRSLILLTLVCFVRYSLQYRYEYVLEDENVFSDCDNAPPGTQNINGLWDMSQMTFAMSEKGVHIEGNMTSVWNVQPTDVITVDGSVLYHDRGSWMPTILNMSPKDLCKVLYDERQYWYVYWYRHITNIKEVKDKCLNTPGTIFVFEPFIMNISVGFEIPQRSGRYQIRVMLNAVGPNGVKPESAICFAIRGDFNKIL